MRGTRAVAGWLPAVVLVPATLAALVQVGVPSDSTEETMSSRVQPLEPGTTWVYAVSDHGQPSGTRVRQVLGPSQLFQDGALRTGVRISSVYDEYPGRGALDTEVYVGVEGKDLMQYGLISRGDNLEISPPAPAYRLPAELGTSWDYDGELGNNPLVFHTEVDSVGDVEAGGRTFQDCTKWVSTVEIADAEVEGATELLEEWTCPGVGVVRSTDVYEAGDVEITEELVAFRGVQENWVAEPLTETPTDPDGTVTTAGIDQARSNAARSASMSPVLAWSEARDATSWFAPVSDGSIVVRGEGDGTVTAREVESGETRWQLALTPPIVASPTIGDGLVYVADGAKNLWALSTADGSATWVHHLDDVVSATPTVNHAVVAVAVEDGSVVALAPADGDNLWSVDLAGVARTPPALVDDQLVVGDDSGALTAIDVDSGDTSWSSAVEGGLEQGPAAVGSQVLAVDATGVVSAFDVDDGAVEWQARAHGFPSQAMAVGAGRVVTVAADGRVEAHALDDGDPTWSRKLQASDVAPVIVGDQVVVVSESGKVQVLDVTDGAPVESWSLPRPSSRAELTVTTPIGLVGETLVVTAGVTDPHFNSISYAYRLDDAERPGVAFTASAGGAYPVPIASEPVLDGDDVYVLDSEGILYREGEGGPQPILDGVQPAVGFAARDGVVVVPVGEEVWGVRGEDGKRLWTLPGTEAYVESIPAIHGDTAFVPLHGAGLAAVDLRTGDPIWVVPTEAATGTSTPLPLPGGDVVYGANGLARFDGRTGREVWRLGGDLAGAVTFSRAAVDHGVVVATLVSQDPTAATGERSRVVAVDAASGRVLWQRDLSGLAVAIPPAAGDGVAVVVDGTNLASVLDLTTGEVRWTTQLGSVPEGPPSVDDGLVTLVERGRSEDLQQREFMITVRAAATGTYLGSYEPPSSNYATLSTVGLGPEGERLVPTSGGQGLSVVVLEADR